MRGVVVVVEFACWYRWFNTSMVLFAWRDFFLYGCWKYFICIKRPVFWFSFCFFFLLFVFIVFGYHHYFLPQHTREKHIPQPAAARDILTQPVIPPFSHPGGQEYDILAFC